jgi:hypothetical protein
MRAVLSGRGLRRGSHGVRGNARLKIARDWPRGRLRRHGRARGAAQVGLTQLCSSQSPFTRRQWQRQQRKKDPTRATIAVRRGTTSARAPSPHRIARAGALGGLGEEEDASEAGALAGCVGSMIIRRPSAPGALHQPPHLSSQRPRLWQRQKGE